jgi:hypothetical protein
MAQPVSVTKSSDARAPRPMVEIFDPPMCCPTGMCGPSLDQTLLDVNDLAVALQAEGVSLERYQMASRPEAFLSNPEVMRLVREHDLQALPITLVKGRLIATGAYPTAAEVREALAEQPR